MSYVYTWEDTNWLPLSDGKDGWEVHDLNIDHPVARKIDTYEEAQILAASADLLKACIEMTKTAECYDPDAWTRLHDAIKKAGVKHENP